MIDRRYIREFDIPVFLIICALAVIGILTVMSATYIPSLPKSSFYYKQLSGVLSGLVIYFLCCFVDYRSVERWCYFAYYLMLIILAITLVKGTITMGGQRWVDLGFFKFQPSELAKILFAPLVTYYLATEKNGNYTRSTYMPLSILLLITTVLVLKQPDLGTAIIVFLSGFTLLWLAGFNPFKNETSQKKSYKKIILLIILMGCVAVPIFWRSLKTYQKERILVFLGQGSRRKERYQIEQSIIAVGSGGFTGKGFLQGTQNTLHFLPEGRTDFIFSVFCEEWGFLGAILLLLLYGLLFIRIFKLAKQITSHYAQLLVTGLTLPLCYATIINLCMVLGLLPTVGIPLPFMSYGVSHLWSSFIALGIVQSILMRRFTM